MSLQNAIHHFTFGNCLQYSTSGFIYRNAVGSKFYPISFHLTPPSAKLHKMD